MTKIVIPWYQSEQFRQSAPMALQEQMMELEECYHANASLQKVLPKTIEAYKLVSDYIESGRAPDVLHEAIKTWLKKRKNLFASHGVRPPQTRQLN